MHNTPQSNKWPLWFDPRHRKMGSWAFILNRITAIGLTVYLCMHLIVLSKLAMGPEAYDSFIALAKKPAVIIGEMFVIAGAIIHGLNGIRITITSFGFGVRYQKPIFIGLMVIAGAAIFLFGYKIFSEL